MRHWQLAVAKHNLKCQAHSAATCFHRTRIQMVGFHAWCQNTAERCRIHANQQTVLRALRLASENIPTFKTSKDHDKASLPLFIANFKAPWCGSMVSVVTGKVVLSISCREIENGDACSENNVAVLEHVPHCPPVQQQRSSLASAKGVMVQCAFGLRFSATADDVSWAANIRRFVHSSFDDPLFNWIVVEGVRFVQQSDSAIPRITVLIVQCRHIYTRVVTLKHLYTGLHTWRPHISCSTLLAVLQLLVSVLFRRPRQWTRHGGLKASFLSHPPCFSVNELGHFQNGSQGQRPSDSRADSKVILHSVATSSGGAASGCCQDNQDPKGLARCKVGQRQRVSVPIMDTFASDSQHGKYDRRPTSVVSRSREAQQKLTVSAAANARPPMMHDQTPQIVPELRHNPSERNECIDSGSCSSDLDDYAQQHSMGHMDCSCMDEALASGTFSALLKDCAGLPVPLEQQVNCHAVPHSLPAQRVADRLGEARSLQEQISGIRDKISAFQHEAQVGCWLASAT